MANTSEPNQTQTAFALAILHYLARLSQSLFVNYHAESEWSKRRTLRIL